MTPITSIPLLPSPSSPPQQKRKRPGTCPAVPEVGSAKATTRWNWEQTLRVFIFFLPFWFSFAQGGAECCGGEYLAYQLRHITLLGFWSYFQPLKGEEGFLAHSNFPLFKRAGPRPSWQFCFPTSLHPGVHSSKRIPPPSPPPARRSRVTARAWPAGAPPPAARTRRALRIPRRGRGAARASRPEVRPSAWKGAARARTDAAGSARVSVRRPGNSGLRLPLLCSVTPARGGLRQNRAAPRVLLRARARSAGPRTDGEGGNAPGAGVAESGRRGLPTLGGPTPS